MDAALTSLTVWSQAIYLNIFRLRCTGSSSGVGVCGEGWEMTQAQEAVMGGLPGGGVTWEIEGEGFPATWPGSVFCLFFSSVGFYKHLLCTSLLKFTLWVVTDYWSLRVENSCFHRKGIFLSTVFSFLFRACIQSNRQTEVKSTFWLVLKYYLLLFQRLLFMLLWANTNDWVELKN